MENVTGLLRVRVVRGVNLAKRDAGDSDAYVVVLMGDQKLKTNVKKNSLNPEWNEDLNFCVSDPTQPLKIDLQEIYDKDTLTQDDKMGDAELDIQQFMEAVKMGLADLPNGFVIETMRPGQQNCLAGDSTITSKDGTIAQDVVLQLRNVESGKVELQLLWLSVPCAPDF
ncbi:protein C2-DOMAIN ABA-RELATED 7 isoform X1 [Musa acuminata AAA Group]|uniref:protein C2-DOMAIN ABA-RELATED 7 isoform X1 n=1 Tax=Musa acuminata AAA Group TaxID=214697 RepID=UPI0031E1867D